MKKITSFAFLALVIIFCSSCSYQKSSHNIVAKNIHTPIFISLPKSLTVFENVSPIIYKEIWKYFHNIGYNLANNDKDASVLKIKIKSLDPSTKFISSDVILCSMQVKLELECTAFDKNQKQIAQKTFQFFALISMPQNTILNPGVFEYEYTRLMQRAAPKIERYFRKYWVSKN